MSSEIPIIDLSEISLVHVDVGYKKYERIGSELHRAFSMSGFAYLKNHGIPEKIVTDCMEAAKQFFLADDKAKAKYSRGVQEIHGYSSKGREVLDESVVEAKESFDVKNLEDSASFPDEEAPEMRPKVKALAHQSVILSRRLLRCLADDLGTDARKFLRDHSDMFGDNNATSIRLLHYPPMEEADDSSVTRCGAHTDYGGLTLLFQDCLGGLEIQTLEGLWIAAPPIPGTIVVNIGDLLQFWSGGRYRATPHRVQVSAITKTSPRFSVALFVHPNHDVRISPIGRSDRGPNRSDRDPMDRSNADGEMTAADHETTAADHARRRFHESYAKRN